MRLTSFVASVLAATFVAAQDLTSTSTFTSYITVERVVATAYATPSSVAIDTELPHEPTWSTTAAPSMTPVVSGNITQPAYGTGTTGLPSASSDDLPPQQTGNAAAHHGTHAYTFAAFAGVIALAAL